MYLYISIRKTYSVKCGCAITQFALVLLLNNQNKINFGKGSTKQSIVLGTEKFIEIKCFIDEKTCRMSAKIHLLPLPATGLPLITIFGGEWK
jgi:hypothetical protein